MPGPLALSVVGNGAATVLLHTEPLDESTVLTLSYAVSCMRAWSTFPNASPSDG